MQLLSLALFSRSRNYVSETSLHDSISLQFHTVNRVVYYIKLQF